MGDRSDRRPDLRLVSTRDRDASTGSGPAGAGAEATDAADQELVRAFLAGDDDAFGELVRRHERVVLRIAGRYAGPEEARDLAQRAFLKAYQATRRAAFFRRGSRAPFRAWLLRVAVNLAKNHARDARRWRRAPAEVAELVEVPAVGSAGLEDAERIRALRAAVVTLPRRQREVLTLRLDAELSFAEIGEVLGITENNAKVHFHHASKRLRALVAGGEEP
jgi:RNA polymerase sigma-70 factor (ECF subfamily)